MNYDQKVKTIIGLIEQKEMATLSDHPVESSYIVTYDLHDNRPPSLAAEDLGRDIVKDVLLGMEAVQLSGTSIGFITNLYPDELYAILEPEVKDRYDPFWIVTAISPFEGRGVNVSHDWLWAMRSAE